MSQALRVLSLFSGIGGFDLGLERAGMKTVAFCEIEPYCRAVLAKHWPGVKIYDDVRTLSADTLRRDGITGIDAICGGFPCQDISFAGKRAGLEGERSGLWSEIRRLAGELRPRFVILENVPGLLSLGMDAVLGDLSTLGYDAVWDCIPASAVGAPHRRDRVWIVAHAQSERRGETGGDRRDEPAQRTSGSGQDVADAHDTRLEGRQRGSVSERTGERIAWEGGASVRNATITRLSDGTAKSVGQPGSQSKPERSDRREPQPGLGGMADEFPHWVDPSAWLEEPENIPRVTKGQENRAARLKALGNAIVPAVAYQIGRAIVQAHTGGAS